MSPLLLPFEFSKVIPHSENKIKRGLKKKLHSILERCFLLHQIYIVRKLSHGRGLRAAPPTPPARLFCRWQELLPRQNCWPEASLGEVPCASRTRRGMTRMIMSPAQSQKTSFAVTLCRGGKSWLFWERQIRASLTHNNLPCQMPGSIWSHLSPSRTLPALSIPTIMPDIRRPMGKEDLNL